MSTARLSIFDKEVELPLVVGSEGEVGIDVARLRAETGAVTLDPGYVNTGSALSSITFIDGEQGILRHRGYSIEELAEKVSFIEVAYLLVYGHLPTTAELNHFTDRLAQHSLIHEDMKKLFEGFPPNAQPMGVLSTMVASLSTYYPESDDPEVIDLNMVRLMAKLNTIAAFAHKKSIGQPYVYPRNDLSYAADFLYMMFSVPAEAYEAPKVHAEVLDMLLVLHADHEQNCSTSAVRMVGSSQASLFASIASGVAALSGPLHGGANVKVVEMLEMIQRDGGDYKKYVNKAKDKDDPFRLFGFGHRVYKNFDPRSRVIKKKADELLARLGVDDPLLEIAQRLEEIALHDGYFAERKLYPNVDFYSGILYRAMGIPVNMFTVMFALGRLPGWMAHWKEMRDDSRGKIHRPRQIYVGEPARPVIPLSER